MTWDDYLIFVVGRLFGWNEDGTTERAHSEIITNIYKTDYFITFLTTNRNLILSKY
jgi:hypothetical protein